VCINTTVPGAEFDEQLSILGEQVVTLAQTYRTAVATQASA
jgi:hypothetical protein